MSFEVVRVSHFGLVKKVHFLALDRIHEIHERPFMGYHEIGMMFVEHKFDQHEISTLWYPGWARIRVGDVIPFSKLRDDLPSKKRRYLPLR